MNSSSKAEDLTTDLYAAALWAMEWDMEFNRTKCKILYSGRAQAPDKAFEAEHDRDVLVLVNSFKD